MLKVTEINKEIGCYKVSADTNGYLLVRNGRSLMIDCPAGAVKAELEKLELPLPDVIIHTQIQAEHCNERNDFPNALIYVPAGTTDLATCSSTFFKDCNTIWASDRNWEKRGEEKYGIAGCVTARPPAQPLTIEDELADGEELDWEDLTIEAIGLPGSGKHAIGLYLREQKCLFSGDLIYNSGTLANLYDLEWNYELRTGYEQLKESLNKVNELDISTICPSTGPVIEDVTTSIQTLLERIDWVFNPPTRRETEEAGLTNFESAKSFGRFRQIVEGIYQNNNSGNMVVLIDEEGRGLVIDPDPCVSWDEDEELIAADLKELEENAGLKTIDTVLVTHYHGDHVQFCDYLIKNYDCHIMTSKDVAAIMMEPEEHNLPCTIDWYNMPVDHVVVDETLAYEHQFNWHNTEITPIHTPGHCNAHVGFLLQWGEEKVAIVGDTIKYGKGPISANLPVIYNDTAWPEKGVMTTLNRLKKYQPTLIIGGHSHACKDPDGAILEDMLSVNQQALGLAAAMVADNNLKKAMTPPNS